MTAEASCSLAGALCDNMSRHSWACYWVLTRFLLLLQASSQNLGVRTQPIKPIVNTAAFLFHDRIDCRKPRSGTKECSTPKVTRTLCVDELGRFATNSADSASTGNVRWTERLELTKGFNLYGCTPTSRGKSLPLFSMHLICEFLSRTSL
ncbi:hypothetical protein F5Y18DRAFT_404740 [Xylariaceae sp. FL1019]|nr:hypothetical protein F5Y18DRAFT_404740 [Xylariaceae sp. FL1019]